VKKKRKRKRKAQSGQNVITLSSVTTVPGRRAKVSSPKSKGVKQKKWKSRIEIFGHAEQIKIVEFKEHRRSRLAVEVVSYLCCRGEVMKLERTKQVSQASSDEPPMVQPLQLRAAK
jgi:hypothetical protein